jgi:hypothetical protein
VGHSSGKARHVCLVESLPFAAIHFLSDCSSHQRDIAPRGWSTKRRRNASSPTARSTNRSPARVGEVHRRQPLTPYHMAIFPVSSRNGSKRIRNQRKSPSWWRMRASMSPASPEINSCRHFCINDGKSSGWIATCQPQPCDSPRVKTGVFAPSLIHELHGTVGTSRPCKRRNSVNDPANGQRLFRPRGTIP